VSDNRSYWGVFEHYFPYLWFTGTESETTHYSGRKTGLCIPFWLAKLLIYGMRYAEMEKRPVLRMPVFGDRIGGDPRRL